MTTKLNLKNLTKEIPYKWKVQTKSKGGSNMACVAYIDARDVMNLLDEVVSPENWKTEYKEVHVKRSDSSICGSIQCTLYIKINNEWVGKTDTGENSNNKDTLKDDYSDALKRASVHWGVGRFLYDLPIQYCYPSNNDKYPSKTMQGKAIYDPKELTDYIMTRKVAPTFLFDKSGSPITPLTKQPTVATKESIDKAIAVVTSGKLTAKQALDKFSASDVVVKEADQKRIMEAEPAGDVEDINLNNVE